MPYRLKPPVLREFPLSDADKLEGIAEGETKIEVRAASTGDQEAVANLRDRFDRTINSGGQITISQSLSLDDIEREEVFRTLASSNILKADGSPLFRFQSGRLASRAEFSEAWAELGPHYARNIKKCVREMNPEWGPAGEV